MSPIDRLFTYFESKGIKPTRLEKEIGLSNGYLGNTKRRGGDLGTGILQKIVDYCSDLNLNWLLTGKGSMLLSTLQDSVELPKTKNDKNVTNQIGNKKGNAKGNIQNLKEKLPSDLCPKCELNEEKLAYQAELISMLREKVSDKEEIISHLKDMLEMIQKGPDRGKNGHHSSQAS
jgi:hypothetical protein